MFGLLDFIWLGKVGKRIYQDQLGSMLAPKPNMAAALAFYAIYVIGVTYFVTMPAVANQSWTRALVGGLLLGLVAYATWNLTNLAVLKDYPAALVPVDMAWGTIATGVTGVVGYWLVRLFTGGS